MKSQKFLSKLLLWCSLVALLDGCTVTNKITKRSQLFSPLETGPITLLARDSTLYVLANYRLQDSSLVGSGTCRKHGVTQNFSGELRLSDIGYIRAKGSSFFKGLLTLGFTGWFIGLAATGIGGSDGLSVTERITYPPGGHSCPFVYGWDGHEYRLQGEAFGVGLGRGLELTTCTVLPSVREQDGLVKVRIANERWETQYVNAVKLVTVETPRGASVVADDQTNLWPVMTETPPIIATDHSHHDIVSKVRAADGEYWESDLGESTVGSSFEDNIEACFPVTAGSENGSLVIRAINTNLSETVYARLGRILGDEALAFADAIDHDSVTIRLLRSWRSDASLKVSLWSGDAWEHIGTIWPEANAVPFAKVVRIATHGRKDSLRVRLTCLTDVWKIDAIGIDWTPAVPLEQREVDMVEANGPRKNDPQKIAANDSLYAVMLPGEKIDLTFEAMTPSAGKRLTYAAHVRGYLHEWTSDVWQASGNLAREGTDGEHKLPLVKALLGNRSLLLSLIYAEWKQQRKVVGSSMR